MEGVPLLLYAYIYDLVIAITRSSITQSLNHLIIDQEWHTSRQYWPADWDLGDGHPGWGGGL